MKLPNSKRKAGELGKLAALYTKLRGSKEFLIVLVSIISSWITVHFLFGIDPEWGGLNLFLSSEASVALALYTVESARQEKQATEQMALHQRTLEYLVDINTAMQEVVEQLAQEKEKAQ